MSVHVTDKRGRDVAGLGKSDFTLFEDGVPRTIAFFAPEKQPASLGVLLDTSSSMRGSGKLERAKAVLSELIASGNPENEIFFMEFAS